MTPATPLNIGIVGVGLMGGSLGMALRRSKRRANGKRPYKVLGLVRKKRQLMIAKKKGAIDSGSTRPQDILPQCDVVVISIPVDRIVPFVEKNLRRFKKGAILTDVGSVKGNVINGIHHAIKKRPDLQFAGAHPIAGSEKSGVENANANLFKNTTCVVTKDFASFKALEVTRSLWLAAGARCMLLDAAQHDACLALTSHVPHLLAFALFDQVEKLSKTNPLLKHLVGGSFRDMTRIAGADAELWSGILKSNRTDIKKALTLIQKDLLFFSQAPSQAIEVRLRRLAQAKKSW